MENFCYGPLWNSSLSWNTSNPNLTPCLRDAILPSISCGFLWISLPMWYIWVTNYVPKLRAKSKNTEKQSVNHSSGIKDRLTFLFCAKVLFNLVIVLNGLGELWWRSSKYQELYGSEVLYPVLITITALLALVMMLAEKKHLIRSSAPLSLFWPLLLISILPNFKLEMEILLENLDTTRLLLTMTFAPAAFMLFILNMWADNHDLEPIDAESISPNNMNSFLSAIFLSWMDPLIWKGYKAPLVQADLYNPPTKVNVDHNVEQFHKNYREYLAQNDIHFNRKSRFGQKRASFVFPLLKTFAWTFAFGNCLAFIHYTVTFGGPQVLKLLLAHIEDPEDHPWKGYFYASLMLIIYITNTIFFQNYLIHFYTVSLNARSVVISAITRKSLKLSNPARQKFTTGQITNLVSVDAQRLMETVPYLAILWAAPYQAILAMVFLYMELGPAALAGVAVLAILIPINAIGSKFGEILQRAQLKAKDSRIKLMNEILAGIKVLKLYAWEIPFMKRILSIRDKELAVIKKNGILNAMNNFTYSCSPILITLGAFSTYVLLNPEENVLTPQKVFVSMALFNLVRVPLTLFPMTLREVIKTYVSIKRINDFMNAEELEEEAIEEKVTNPDNAIEVNDASLAWDSDDRRPILKKLNFVVKKGSLTAIVGSVGAGKSSVLSALLGEMEKVDGNLARQGSVAYVAQQAWIQNLTLRDNILFGKSYEASKYKQVIEGCSLKTDLQILMQGDATEIGENGINLSGGQKQRVNLARAVYADCDIYMLDDPLSAVDAHVGKHIFEHVISNEESSLLKDKTRVWVTNNLSYLTAVDNIIVLSDGEIVEQGSYRDLVRSKSTLMSLIQQGTERRETELSNNIAEDTLEPIEEKTSNDVADEKEEEDFSSSAIAGQLVKDERSETGSVKFSVYLEYFKSLTYSYSIAFFTLVAAQQAFHLGGNIWLSKWSDTNNPNVEVTGQEETGDVTATYYLTIYAILGATEVCLKLGNDLAFYIKCAGASKVIHKKLLDNVMRSPMRFFDTNPTGRIVNRFTSDLDTMDAMIPFGIMDFSWCLVECIVVIFLISYTTPLFIAVIVPLMLIYYFVQRVYITTSRQLKRLYSITKSPIFSHFTEITNGAMTIRAYQMQQRFVQESQDRVSINVKSVYLNFMSNRWLGMRLENIGNLVIFFSALFAIIAKDSLTAGEAGLSITSSLQIIGALVWVVRVACQLETDCVAVERIMEYTRTEQEASWEEGQDSPGKNWPDQGAIEFQNYQTRYREGLDLVLKGIDMNVSSEEKIGICGRTGAGKSSLTLALFRIIEPTAGKIVIDGQDISLLGLHSLRSKLTIIPQDPVLFTGDIRFNLDPLGQHDDAELWRCLELAHLKDHVEQNLQHGLDSQVSEAGANFSVGQRQLICLARALLRKTKILVLDEATAAIDQETDDLIQSTLRKEFSDCTVLTIAHRLNTIMDSDRVAVFNKGTLEEFESPQKLLSTEGSSFKAMASDSNLM